MLCCKLESGVGECLWEYYALTPAFICIDTTSSLLFILQEPPGIHKLIAWSQRAFLTR